jgi:hypothetical protein
MRAIPTDSETLLGELEQQYPPRCRMPDETERDHERYAGKVDLINEIRTRLDRMPSTTF